MKDAVWNKRRNEGWEENERTMRGGRGGGVCPEKESKGNGESRSYFSIKEKLTVQQEQKSVF